MKSTLPLPPSSRKAFSPNAIAYYLFFLIILLLSTINLAAQKNNYTDSHFDGKDKCGLEEMIKNIENQGLYEEEMKKYAAFADKAIKEYRARKAEKTDTDCPNGLIVIPIAFNIFHESGAAIGTGHNWSLAQLEAVIGSLNADFGGYNTNKDLIDECFQDVDAYNTCIQFCMGKINRVDGSTCPAYGLNQDYELSDCIHEDSDDYLNVYSSDIGGLGIASNIAYPGNPFGECDETYDGVYVDWDAFTVGAPANAPFDGGKTLTHEVGHWIGLYHVFQGCTGFGDGISDTPPQSSSTGGCPFGKDSCAGGKPDMIYNHMDYSDDACLAMFTEEQAAIMQAVMADPMCRLTLSCSSQRGNCDGTISAVSNVPSAANTQAITISDCVGDIDFLDIQSAWYGYPDGTTCFNWVEGATDVDQIGDLEAEHSTATCGGATETRTFNLMMQPWDEATKMWGAEVAGGTVNLSIECPPSAEEATSTTADATGCNMNPVLMAVCPECPCAFDNDNMTITVEVTGTHTWVSDLAFYLQGPGGTVTMGNSTCSNSGDDFNGLTFTSGATTTYDACGAATPLSGIFTVDFSALDGADFNAAGWNLIIGDCAGQDTGNLTNYTITIEDNGGGMSCLAGMAGGITFSDTGSAIADNMCAGGLTEVITFPPVAGSAATTTWWTAATGGTQVGTGASFDTSTDAAFDNSADGVTTYYVQCACDPCDSERTAVTATISGCVPVELLAFTGKTENGTVALDWMTASEIDNSHFEVERSFDGNKFEVLGKVQGAGTTVITQLYNFMDLTPRIGVNYYRLKQIDLDGEFDYSPTIAIDLAKEKITAEVFPSPASGVLNVRVNKAIANIQIYDLTGRTVATYILDGATTTQLHVATLRPGTYFVSIQSENTREVVRFIKD